MENQQCNPPLLANDYQKTRPSVWRFPILCRHCLSLAVARLNDVPLCVCCLINETKNSSSHVLGESIRPL